MNFDSWLYLGRFSKFVDKIVSKIAIMIKCSREKSCDSLKLINAPILSISIDNTVHFCKLLTGENVMVSWND